MRLNSFLRFNVIPAHKFKVILKIMGNASRWPVGIAATYIAFVIIVIGIVIFSTYHKVDLVSEDYYEQEIKYQQQIDRINRTRALSKSVEWHYDKQLRLLTLHFPEELESRRVQGQVLFFRPSDARQDNLIELQLTSGNTQIINTQHLIPGLWKLKIFWKVNDRDYYTEGTLVI